MSHNKTLAAQLYSEFKNFFPHNAVEYFVSYFDYYQPEAYIPRSDTYIEKDSSINDEIERLRLSTMGSLITRHDTIVVASVSCIYGLGLVVIEVGNEVFHRVVREEIFELRVELGGERFVVAHDQRRAVLPRDKIRHGKCFARTRDTEKRLVLVARGDGFRKFFNRLRLIAHGPIVAGELEIHVW
jgi:hypothetical protein